MRVLIAHSDRAIALWLGDPVLRLSSFSRSADVTELDARIDRVHRDGDRDAVFYRCRELGNWLCGLRSLRRRASLKGHPELAACHADLVCCFTPLAGQNRPRCAKELF